MDAVSSPSINLDFKMFRVTKFWLDSINIFLHVLMCNMNKL